MPEDAVLLTRYAENGSEVAFAELIRRHVDLVYSAALRLMNGDVHRAQDVTQQVFVELARQARRLTNHPALLGWLYTTTRRMALRVVRSEQRRVAREQEANTMSALLHESSEKPDWDQLRPVLEDAMHELDEKDRLAVLHRFFRNKSLREVGVALGLNENAARMRVERALEKLRTQLARKGVTSTTAALALALTGNAVTAAPAGFTATLTTASLAAGAAVASGTTLGVLKFMTMNKLAIGVVSVAVVAGVATPIAIHHRAQVELGRRAEALRREDEQLAQLVSKTAQLSNLLAHANQRNDQLEELLRRQSEVTQVRPDSSESRGIEQMAAEGKGSLPTSGRRIIYSGPDLQPLGVLRKQTLDKLARMTAKLGLSVEQKEAVRKIMLNHAAAFSQNTQNKLLAGELTPSQYEAMIEDTDNDKRRIEALLTPDQLAAYSEFQKEESESQARQRARRLVSRLADDLGLNPQQAEAVRSVLSKFYVERQLETAKYTGPTTATGWSKDLQIQLAQQWSDETIEAFKGILNAKQLQAFREDEQVRLDAMRLALSPSASIK